MAPFVTGTGSDGGPIFPFSPTENRSNCKVGHGLKGTRGSNHYDVNFLNVAHIITNNITYRVKTKVVRPSLTVITDRKHATYSNREIAKEAHSSSIKNV